MYPGIYIILASILWWIDGFVRQNFAINSYLLIALEFLPWGILGLMFLMLFRRKAFKKIHNFPILLLHVIITSVAGSWFFIQSVKATESLGLIFVLVGLQPIFTILTSQIALREHPKNSFYAFAATTIFASILLTLWETGFNIRSDYFLSYIFALLTAICWGSWTVFNKITLEKNDALYAMSIRYIFASCIAAALLLFTEWNSSFQGLWTIIWDNLFGLLFLILGSNLLWGIFFYQGLKKIPASIASIFELAFPLTGFVIDFMIHDIVPSPIKIVAALTIIVSIIILPYCHFLEGEKKEKIISMA